MALITYVFRPGVTGGTVNPGDGSSYNLATAMAAGGGQITVDTVAQPGLAAALAASTALLVSGSAPGTPVFPDRIGPVLAHIGSPGSPNDILVRGSDGIFTPQQTLPPGAGGGTSAPNVVGALATSLPTAVNVAMSQTQEQWLAGTLIGNTTVTFTSFPLGSKAKFQMQQDGVGSRTLTITDGQGHSQVLSGVPTSPGSIFEVYIDCPDGLNIIASVLAPVTATAGVTWTVNVLTSSLTAIASQTTLQNLTSLAFNIGSTVGEMWFFKGWLIFSAANNVMDLKIGLTGPAGATATWGAIGGTNGGYSTATTAGAPAAAGALGGSVAFGTLAGITGIPIAGIVTGGGTAGAITPQYAQNTSDAGNLQVLAGSLLEYTKVH